jgi:hypothetical protein
MQLCATFGPEIQWYLSLRRGEDIFKTVQETPSALYAAGAALNWVEYPLRLCFFSQSRCPAQLQLELQDLLDPISTQLVSD